MQENILNISLSIFLLNVILQVKNEMPEFGQLLVHRAHLHGWGLSYTIPPAVPIV